MSAAWVKRGGKAAGTSARPAKHLLLNRHSPESLVKSPSEKELA